jgi:hypothetical protein
MILEIVHTDDTRTLHRVGDTPLTLGRAFASDLVIDDPYVDAIHARLLRNDAGQFVLEDLGTVNGFVVNGTRSRGSLTLQAGDEVRLGRTTLRLRDPNEPVPPALPDDVALAPKSSVVQPERVRHALTDWPRWIATTPRRLAVVAAATAVFALNTWLGTADRSSASDVFSITLGILLIAAAWAAIWAVVGRVVVHRFDFARHFAIVTAVFLAAIIGFVIQDWLNFLFPDSNVVTTFGALVSLTLLTILIVLHLTLASALPHRRRWRAGVIAAASVFAIVAALSMADDEPFSDVPDFSSAIKPLAPKWVPTSTVAEFSDVPRSLKEQVDALAAQK